MWFFWNLISGCKNFVIYISSNIFIVQVNKVTA